MNNINLRIQYEDGSVQSGYRITITPDLARQIVALAYGATGWLTTGPAHPSVGGIIVTQPHAMGGQGPQHAQPSGSATCDHHYAKTLLAPGPVARWCPDCNASLPVDPPAQPSGDDAAIRALQEALEAVSPCSPWNGARAILAAIRAGNVPGIYDADAVKAEQAAMYAAGTRDGIATCQKEINQLRADLDHAETKWHEAEKESDNDLAGVQSLAQQLMETSDQLVKQNEALKAKARMLDDAAATLDTLGVDKQNVDGHCFTVGHRISVLNDEAEREKGLAYAAVQKAEETSTHLSDIIASRDAAIKKLEADMETHQNQWQVVRVIAERDKALADLAAMTRNRDYHANNTTEIGADYSRVMGKLAKAEADLAAERERREQDNAKSEVYCDQIRAEAEALRAELAALTGRKVKLPIAMAQTIAGWEEDAEGYWFRKSQVIHAIRAAGVDCE